MASQPDPHPDSMPTDTPERELPLPDLPEPEMDPAADTLRPELGGRAGPEPTRYGDWENKGIASDF